MSLLNELLDWVTQPPSFIYSKLHSEGHMILEMLLEKVKPDYLGLPHPFIVLGIKLLDNGFAIR